MLNKYFFAIVIFFGSALIYFCFDLQRNFNSTNQAKQSSENSNNLNNLSPQTEEKENITHSSTKLNNQKEKHSKPNQNIMENPEHIRQIENLFNENSVFDSNRDNKDYSGYSSDILEELANSGDVYAMKEIAYRAIKSLDKNKENMGELLGVIEAMASKTVIAGDLDLAGFLPEFSETPYYDPALPQEKRNEVLVNKLALGEFYALRGAYHKKVDEHFMFFNLYKIDTSQLTPQTKEAIKTRAKEIYDHYEGLRIEQGFGAFDNSAPEGVQLYFEELKTKYHEMLGNLAI